LGLRADRQIDLLTRINTAEMTAQLGSSGSACAAQALVGTENEWLGLV
jgi:hypothetical protein